MAKIDQPEIVFGSELAVKIGELLCDALYGDLSRQRPLSATDKEGCWRVEGNWNRNGLTEGLAEFFLSIEKSNGRVTDIGEAMRVTPHPSVAALFSEHIAQKTEGRTGAVAPVYGSSKLDEIDPEATARCMLLLNNLGHGGLVFSDDLAVDLGHALCDAHYGDIQRQMPLAAIDKGTYWRVEGNWNRDGKVRGAGPFFVSIEKYDARVTEIGE